MCGFAGFFCPRAPVDAKLLQAMTESLAHRGPDDHGYFGWEADVQWRRERDFKFDAPLRVGLGFRRLSILDLSEHGAQPMGSEDDRHWLAFNGQIYNYRELRGELGQARWRSDGDTEVLLRLLSRDGTDALPRLNGMFAFAFFDRAERELTLARDPLGIKPLYYFRDERGFFFASEIRALLKARAESPRLRRDRMSRFLLTNALPDPETLFEGIQKLEPGHYLVINERLEIRHQCFWDFEYQPDEKVSGAEWERRLDEALRHSAERHLRSDVPVGFFLSGGVDSSLLAALATKQNPPSRTAYTIGFRWSQGAREEEDLHYARQVAKQYQLNHREILLEPEILSVLPKVIEALEEPIVDPAAICSYLIAQAARSELKVLWSGQGADELFGGYPVYQAGAVAGGMPGWVRAPLAALLTATPYAGIQAIHRAKKIVRAAAQPWPESFLALRAAMRPDEALAVLHPDLRDQQVPAYAPQHELAAHAKDWDRLAQMRYLDTKTYLPSINLAYSDKTSMAHSVELRVPLLDREILDLVRRIPSERNISRREGKRVLKRVARKYLPSKVVYRRKAGFGIPLRAWFRKELQPLAAEMLAPDYLRAQGIFDPELPTKWLEAHRKGRADYGMRLYALVAFQLWWDAFGVR